MLSLLSGLVAHVSATRPVVWRRVLDFILNVIRYWCWLPISISRKMIASTYTIGTTPGRAVA
jgi:hypothetical protein